MKLKHFAGFVKGWNNFDVSVWLCKLKCIFDKINQNLFKSNLIALQLLWKRFWKKYLILILSLIFDHLIELVTVYADRWDLDSLYLTLGLKHIYHELNGILRAKCLNLRGILSLIDHFDVEHIVHKT